MDNTIHQPAPREETGAVPPRSYVGAQQQAIFNRQVREALNARYGKVWWTTTTTASAATIWSMQQPTNTLWLVDLRVMGLCIVDGSGAFYERSVRLSRTTLGAATVVATTTPVADNEDVAGWAITLTPGTDGILALTVTGDAARTVDWVAWVGVQEAPRRT